MEDLNKEKLKALHGVDASKSIQFMFLKPIIQEKSSFKMCKNL